ncbi:MAG: hypothetical protein U0800_16285 [Isosphaeraceae bacterium]
MTLPLDESTVATDATPSPRVSRQGQGGGPKTSFGKEASSKNATTHGLAGRELHTLPDYFQRDVHDRMTYYVAHHQPRCDNDSALCGLAAIGFVQHRESLSEKRQYLRIRSYRAQGCWEIDRNAEVVELALRLSKRPEAVAAALAKTLHGALWLLGRWKHLARCLEVVGDWLEEDVKLAYDLLGRDPAVRQHDPDRLAGGSLAERKDLVAKQIQTLQTLVDGPLKQIDVETRMLAIQGEGFLDDPVYRRIDRYGNRALKLNRDCIAELERRRIARGLDAYNPDGTIATPPPKPGDPTRGEPDPNYRPSFYPIEQIQAAAREAEKPLPNREEPRPESPTPATTSTLMPSSIRNEPAEARRRPSPEQVRGFQRRAAEDRKADRREKERARAERKAAKAARKRNR